MLVEFYKYLHVIQNIDNKLTKIRKDNDKTYSKDRAVWK